MGFSKSKAIRFGTRFVVTAAMLGALGAGAAVASADEAGEVKWPAPRPC